MVRAVSVNDGKHTNSTTHEHNEMQIHNKCMQTKTQNKHKQAKHTFINLKQTRTQTNKHTHINTISSQKHTDVSERNQ